MKSITIKKLENKEEIPWNLLLLADPSRELIEKYLPNSNIYLARIDNQIIGVYVLTPLTYNISELKNIAVDERYQGQGIGKQLVLDAIQKAREQGATRLEVGTGNSSLSQLALYQKCGFRIVGIKKDFFTKNYKEKIVENGIQCIDMIRLAIDL